MRELARRLEHFGEHRAFPGGAGREEPLSAATLAAHQAVLLLGLLVFVGAMQATLGWAAVAVFWSVTGFLATATATSDVWTLWLEGAAPKKAAGEGEKKA